MRGLVGDGRWVGGRGCTENSKSKNILSPHEKLA